MNANELLTKADLDSAIKDIIQHLDTALSEFKKKTTRSSAKFLKTKEVQQLTGYSFNKIKEMRNNNTIPWRKIGGVYAYPEAEVLIALNPEKPTLKFNKGS